jgi:Arc/MetJ-type ribon-helix-helix transcriptional regulator
MASEVKDKLVSFRIPENDYNYVCSTADSKDISSSEFIRLAIKKTREDSSEPARSEVIAYLRNLSASERDEILDKAEKTRKRKIRSFMNDAISRKPGIKGKELCKKVSEEFDLPITLDLKHKVYLRIKSRRRRKNLVGKLEKEY